MKISIVIYFTNNHTSFFLKDFIINTFQLDVEKYWIMKAQKIKKTTVIAVMNKSILDLSDGNKSLTINDERIKNKTGRIKGKKMSLSDSITFLFK